MNAGSAKAMRTIMITFTLAALLAVPAAAQTPQEACAADSLYLISPESVQLRLQGTGRLGLELSWPNIRLDQATCFALDHTDSLDFTVTADGGFGDFVDRKFSFTALDTAVIGDDGARTGIFAWKTLGSSFYGYIEGFLNVANNGGLWRRDDGAGTWTQLNSGLSMAWRQNNLVSLAARADGSAVAAFTSGATLDTDMKGLWTFDGALWQRIAADLFDATVQITQVAVSPDHADHFAVGTRFLGLFVTRDGGQSFTRWAGELDPALTPPTNLKVSALSWSASRLVAAVANFGVFYSEDDGLSFATSPFLVRENLDKPASAMVVPGVNELTVDPQDDDRLLAALANHGVFESTDGARSWHDLYGDLVVVNPDTVGLWVRNALSVAVDAGDGQTLVTAIGRKGLYRTTDGGTTWTKVGADVQPVNSEGEPNPNVLVNMIVRADPQQPGLFYALEDKYSLLVSADAGATWDHLAGAPGLRTAQVLVVTPDGSGDLLLGTYGGGLYEPGTPLSLTETMSSATDDWVEAYLDLGLDLTLSPGTMLKDQYFILNCQTFRGYAVWRSPASDPDNMVLLGMYDRENPETCIEGYCGDDSYDLKPMCYASKRAACFDFTHPDTSRFFDDEIYNGFDYRYAVTTFDYGNTALSSPGNNSNPLLFSPRWDGDANSPFTGPGNRVSIQVNLVAAAPVRDETIYVYPNPLRLNAGFPGAEGERVTFTNLPELSRISVFTTAGDRVINLGSDLQLGGNIHWNTVNSEGEPLAAGVYLYKVEMPRREPFWGRLVIIR